MVNGSTKFYDTKINIIVFAMKTKKEVIRIQIQKRSNFSYIRAYNVKIIGQE